MPFDDEIESKCTAIPGFTTAAALAIALSELRLDLAKIDDNEKHDTMASTSTKHKIELFDDIFLNLIDKIQHEA